MNRRKSKNKLVRDKLSLYRGIIISGATDIDICLGLRIRRYFYPKSSKQASILGWELINPLSFDKKIELIWKDTYFQESQKIW